jgi:hypothetical protein
VTRKAFAPALLAAALVLTQAAPGFAQQSAQKPPKTGTIVKWTLIGAGIGAAAGFGLGFRAYDDATFAERKITQAAFAGAAIGAGGGWVIGKSRANASASTTTMSLWTPQSPLRRPATAGALHYDFAASRGDRVAASSSVRTAGENLSIAYRTVVLGMDGPFDRR